MSSSVLVDEIGPFAVIPISLIDQAKDVGTDSIVMWVYLRRMTNSKSNVAWPGYDRIQTNLGWGRSRIAKSLRVLEGSGYLKTERRFGNSNIYRLCKPPYMGGENDEPDSSPGAELLDGTDGPGAELLESQNGTVDSPAAGLNLDREKNLDKNNLDDSPISYDQTPWVMALADVRNAHYRKNKVSWETSPWVQTWVVAGSDGHMIIGCTTEDDAAWLTDRGSAIARSALTGVLGRQVDVEFLGPTALKEVMADAA